MRTRPLLSCLAVLAVAGCAGRAPAPPPPGPETVQVATNHPGSNFVELGPVSGVDGQGCGDSGKRGNRDAAVSALMKNAFAMGGTYVQVVSLHEPRQMGDCYVNLYRINGTAYRRGAPAPTAAAQPAGSGDVVQSLRELQKMRDDGVITQPEFERLKTKIIGG